MASSRRFRKGLSSFMLSSSSTSRGYKVYERDNAPNGTHGHETGGADTWHGARKKKITHPQRVSAFCVVAQTGRLLESQVRQVLVMRGLCGVVLVCVLVNIGGVARLLDRALAFGEPFKMPLPGSRSASFPGWWSGSRQASSMRGAGSKPPAAPSLKTSFCSGGLRLPLRSFGLFSGICGDLARRAASSRAASSCATDAPRRAAPHGRVGVRARTAILAFGARNWPLASSASAAAARGARRRAARRRAALRARRVELRRAVAYWSSRRGFWRTRPTAACWRALALARLPEPRAGIPAKPPRAAAPTSKRAHFTRAEGGCVNFCFCNARWYLTLSSR